MKQKPFSKDPASGLGVPNCTASAEYFLRQRAQTRPKLRQRSLQPSAPQGSKSQFRWRTYAISHAKSEGVRRTWISITSLVTFCSFLPFAQRLAPQILRRSPPSCPGRNDSSAIMVRRHCANSVQKILRNNSQSEWATRRLGEGRGGDRLEPTSILD